MLCSLGSFRSYGSCVLFQCGCIFETVSSGLTSDLFSVKSQSLQVNRIFCFLSYYLILCFSS